MSARRSPGLQPERTALAWRRTALGVLVVALLTARMALSRGTVGVLLAALAITGWIAFLAMTYHRGATVAPRPPLPAGRVLPLSALLAIGYAGLGALLVLTTLG